MDAKARQCRGRFLRFFPKGFQDPTYFDWERNYKWQAHEQWNAMLNPAALATLLREEQHREIALRAVRIESATNLLFSFEKMALRDAVKTEAGAQTFAQGLFDWLHGPEEQEARFEKFVAALAQLPRRQTRVLTWPLLTVFGFLAAPKQEIFLKPTTTRVAAADYGFDFPYASTPTWKTYASLLGFARRIKRDLADLKPRDMIDVQSFIWVLGSSEYEAMSN